MPFWTVEDAGPYKEESTFLMTTSLSRVDFSVAAIIRAYIPTFGKTKLTATEQALRENAETARPLLPVFAAVYHEERCAEHEEISPFLTIKASALGVIPKADAFYSTFSIFRETSSITKKAR